MRSNFAVRLGVCIVVGALGGTLAQHLVPGIAFGPLGSLSAPQFFVVRLWRTLDPGAGLLSGAACAFLLWRAWLGVTAVRGAAAMPMLDLARAAFPQLVAAVVTLGVPVGLALGIVDTLSDRKQQASRSLARALVGGGLAGVVGGWALAHGWHTSTFFR